METLISWRDLTFTVTKKSFASNCFSRNVQNQQVLQPQSGCVDRGSLMAIMGPSGAGKTTLLNCVTGHQVTGVGGSIFMPLNSNKPKISIVPQETFLMEAFTVHETLMFATKMRNNLNTRNQEMKVDQVVNSLNLDECVDTRVSKLSGGQLKRLSIGVEMISSPDILVLDEPTSGLDSMNAEVVVRLLLGLAQEKRMAIVVTIHQPNYLIFSLFSTVYLLSKYGSLIYFGPPSAINPHFESFGLEIPRDASPGDFALVIAMDCQICDQMSKVATNWDHNNNPSAVCLKEAKELLQLKEVCAPAPSPVPIWTQVYLLAVRSLLVSCFRSPRLLSKIIVHMIVIIGISDAYSVNPGLEDGCYFQNDTVNGRSIPTFINERRIAEVINALNFQFSVIMYVMLIYAVGSSLVTPLEFQIVSREMRNQYYSTATYLVSKIFAEIPSLLISCSLALFLIIYCTEQVLTPWRLGLYSAIIVLFCWTCESYGILIGTIFQDTFSATLVTTALLVPPLLFAGLVVKITSMKWYYQHMSHLSIVRAAFESSLIVIYGFQRCPDIPFNLQDGKESITRRKLENIILTALRALGLNEKTIYRFGNMIDVDKKCFKKVTDATFRHLKIFGQGTDKFDTSINPQSSFALDFLGIDQEMLLQHLVILLALGIIFRLATLTVLKIKQN